MEIEVDGVISIWNHGSNTPLGFFQIRREDDFAGTVTWYPEMLEDREKIIIR
jgi:hypothetical protein